MGLILVVLTSVRVMSVLLSRYMGLVEATWGLRLGPEDQEGEDERDGDHDAYHDEDGHDIWTTMTDGCQ